MSVLGLEIQWCANQSLMRDNHLIFFDAYINVLDFAKKPQILQGIGIFDKYPNLKHSKKRHDQKKVHRAGIEPTALPCSILELGR
jgi:hypothetical protein